MNSQIVVNILSSSSLYILIAVGFSLIYRSVRFFHFAHAGIYTLAAYTAYAAGELAGLSPFLVVPIAITVGATVGALMELMFYRPLRLRQVAPVTLLVTSLGILIVLQHGISLFFGDDTKVLVSGSLSSYSIEVLGAQITGPQALLMGSALVSNLLLAVFLRFTRVGVTLRAVAAEPILARAFGLNVDAMILLSFVVGSGLASLGGVAWAYNTALSPQMGFTPLLMGVVAAIVGGIGSLPGAAVGAIFVATVQQLGMWFFPSEWQDMVVFPLLILFLLIKPEGFLGKRIRTAGV